MSRVHVLRAIVGVRCAMRHLEQAEGDQAAEAAGLLVMAMDLLLEAGGAAEEEVDEVLQRTA